jgi:hypothetical protein
MTKDQELDLKMLRELIVEFNKKPNEPKLDLEYANTLLRIVNTLERELMTMETVLRDIAHDSFNVQEWCGEARRAFYKCGKSWKYKGKDCQWEESDGKKEYDKKGIQFE